MQFQFVPVIGWDGESFVQLTTPLKPTLPYPCTPHISSCINQTFLRHIPKKLTQIFSTAYWIAFGPHGPRAVDPPGTNARVAWGVAIGLGVSFGLFAIVRFFAKPVPYTMSQEYQEQSNEFLIVRLSSSPSLPSPPLPLGHVLVLHELPR